MRLNKSVMLSMIILLFLIIVSMVLAQEQSVDVKKIVKKADELYRSESSYGEIEMQIITPHWKRILAMDVWTEGMDKTFIRIKSPKKEEGIATLRIGDEMWNYLPKVNKVMKIPPSMMMSSWMGSDFTNDDLVHEFSLLEDYNYRLYNPENADKNLYYIELIPKKDLPIVWTKLEVAIRKKDYITIWQKYYGERGRLMRQLNFREIKEFGGRKIPSIMEMIPKDEEGNKTVIRYIEAKFDFDIDKGIFTLRNLRK